MSQATSIIKKNSRTIAKLCQLIEVQKKDCHSIDKDSGHISRRVEKLKGRVKRRLLTLARWVDKPESQRYGFDMQFGRTGMRFGSRNGLLNLGQNKLSTHRPARALPQRNPPIARPPPTPNRFGTVETPTAPQASRSPRENMKPESVRKMFISGVTTKTGPSGECIFCSLHFTILFQGGLRNVQRVVFGVSIGHPNLDLGRVSTKFKENTAECL